MESLFGTVKTAPEYPGRFLDQNKTVDYFNRFFPRYYTEYVHSGIEYVTPEQCHRGVWENIVTERKPKLKKQRLLRKEVKRIQRRTVTNDPITHIGNQATPEFFVV